MANAGDKTKVHFRATLDDGTVIEDTFAKDQPIEVVVGSKRSFPGLELTLLDMHEGDTRSVRLIPEEAFGAYDEKLVETVPCENIPDIDRLPIGEYVTMSLNGSPFQMKVLDVQDGQARVDLNHKYAGQFISLDVELIEVRRESAIEREMHPAGCACGCDKVKDALLGHN